MYNWNTAQYVVVGTNAASFNNDATNNYNVTSGIANYVQAGTGQVRSRFGWRRTGFIFLFPWTVSIDRVVWIPE
jgi:hypothetical protein